MKFEIKLATLRKYAYGKMYYFVLIARNGEIVATSEMYESKQACKKGILSIGRNALFAKIVDTTPHN